MWHLSFLLNNGREKVEERCPGQQGLITMALVLRNKASLWKEHKNSKVFLSFPDGWKLQLANKRSESGYELMMGLYLSSANC